MAVRRPTAASRPVRLPRRTHPTAARAPRRRRHPTTPAAATRRPAAAKMTKTSQQDLHLLRRSVTPAAGRVYYPPPPWKCERPRRVRPLALPPTEANRLQEVGSVPDEATLATTCSARTLLVLKMEKPPKRIMIRRRARRHPHSRTSTARSASSVNHEKHNTSSMRRRPSSPTPGSTSRPKRSTDHQIEREGAPQLAE